VFIRTDAIQPKPDAIPADEPSSFTLRVFRKNYRLQDIQLSKSCSSYRARLELQAQRVRSVANLDFRFAETLVVLVRRPSPGMRGLPARARLRVGPGGMNWWRIPGSNR
jgi:hypothetical protein